MGLDVWAGARNALDKSNTATTARLSAPRLHSLLDWGIVHRERRPGGGNRAGNFERQGVRKVKTNLKKATDSLTVAAPIGVHSSDQSAHPSGQSPERKRVGFFVSFAASAVRATVCPCPS